MAAAIRAWNLMGGEINWQAIDAVSEIVGFNDIELLVVMTGAIRDHMRAGNE